MKRKSTYLLYIKKNIQKIEHKQQQQERHHSKENCVNCSQRQSNI